MRKIANLTRGMGIGGWLTNYKRFNVLPEKWKMPITIGDMEHFRTYITENDVKYIAETGFDHIRLGFDQIVAEESPFVYREEIMDMIENFAVLCEKYGVRLVLNLHKCIGNYCDIKEDVTLFDSEEIQNRVIALWVALEKKLGAHPSVAFELLNEVRDVEAGAWNDLYRRMIEAIRALNKTRLIIVGSTHWGSPSTLNRLDVNFDDNVIYTYHMYEPFCFTHQRGVLVDRTLFYNRVMEYPSDDIERYRDFLRLIFDDKDPYPGIDRMDIEFLRRHMHGAWEFIEAHPDKVLWCGEFGSIRHAPVHSRENYMRDMIKLCKEHDMPYCVWNYLSTPNDGNRFSLVDDETRQILTPRLKSILLGNVDC